MGSPLTGKSPQAVAASGSPLTGRGPRAGATSGSPLTGEGPCPLTIALGQAFGGYL